MSHDQIITVALAIVTPALLMNSIAIARSVSAGVRHALRVAVVRHHPAGQFGKLHHHQHSQRRIQLRRVIVSFGSAHRRDRRLQPNLDHRHRVIDDEHHRGLNHHPGDLSHHRHRNLG